MARRLQDPLAELVKIDPKSIGVGQYQHDMNQKKLLSLIHILFPPDGCVLHNLTGYYCPGCGGTRAIHALLHGHIVRYFFYHPIVVSTAVFFGWFMLSQTIEKASRGRLAIGMHYRDI